jgi:hypothetical protein
MGWNARAEALDGHVSVHKHGSEYTALASADHICAGTPPWGVAHARTARAAVAKIGHNIKEHIGKLQKLYEIFGKL